MATKDEGLIFNIRKSQNMELWCDADFCGNWRAETVHMDKTTAKPRTGDVITYAGCPVTWASKMQTGVALSTTEAELIAMSKGLRTAIPIMNLIEEIMEQEIGKFNSCARVHCKVFEDNAGTMTIATMPKIRPRTKFLGIIWIKGKYPYMQYPLNTR